MPERQTRRLREFTVAQVALMCRVSPITVRNWIVRGHIRRNAHGRIDGAALLAYLDNRSRRGVRRPPELTPKE